MIRLLAIFFLFATFIAQAQINKNSWYVSGSLDFDKHQVYRIRPLAGYFITEKDAVGLIFNYENAKQRVIQSTLLESRTNQWSVFYRRYNPLISNTYIFFEANIGMGYGRAQEIDQDIKYRFNGFNAGLQAGFMWFLTPGLSAEIVPFAVNYHQAGYNGDVEIKSRSINGQYSIGNKIGLNIHIKNPGEVVGQTPQDLIDKKVLSGRLIFSQRKNEMSQKNTSIGIAPQLDIFMTNWIQLGVSLSIVSENIKGENIISRSQEKTSNVSFQLGPRIKVYKWLTQTTGIFAQPYLEGAFVFRQFDGSFGSYENKHIESYGGLNIGFSSFLSDRLLLEAQTTVYSVEKNRFSPNLNAMNLSLGWLMK